MMRSLWIALFVAAAVLLAYLAGAGSSADGLVATAGDGSELQLACVPPSVANVSRAEYGAAGDLTDVTEEVSALLADSPSQAIAVSADTLGAPPSPAVRSLRVEYTCGPSAMQRREHIVPRRTNTCAKTPPTSDDPWPRRWTGQRNQNWTVVDQPFDPDSKIQLTAGALTPAAREAHLPINPVTRIGVTARVRNWENPYTDSIFSDPCASGDSVYDVLPRAPGDLIPAANDSTDGTMYQGRTYYQPAYWTRASGPLGGPYVPLSTCSAPIGGRREAFYGQEAPWQNASAPSEPHYGRNTRNLARAAGVALPADPEPAIRRSIARAAFKLPKESLRSRPSPGGDSCMTGIGCGLGATWIDPRFEPGPQAMYPQGDSSWAPGGHAGGPTFGALIPFRFQVPGPHWSQYVQGFGDGQYLASEIP